MGRLFCVLDKYLPMSDFPGKFPMGSFKNYVTHRGLVGLSIFRDVGKQRGEWFLMKGHNVTVKKIIKPFFVLL